MILIGLVWHREADDLEIGDAYLELFPSVGTLLAFPTSANSNVVWRVTQLYVIPAHERSDTVRRVREGRPAQVGNYYAFVVPAEGPYHP